MYYPKSQIKTNLYTNGDKFALASTNETYTGYYYVVSGNEFYTGKNPNDTPNELLIPIPPTPEGNDGTFTSGEIIVQNKNYEQYDLDNFENNFLYSLSSTNIKIENRFLPKFNAPPPTSKDYQLGEFQRYFCKKNNELIYMEINYQTYQDLLSQSPKISFELYTPISIPWSLTGDREQVYNTNKKITLLKEQKLKLYGFSLYFKEDYSKYYLAS